MNLERYPNIYREDKRSTHKVQEINEFIYKIKKARKEVEKALKKINKTIKWRIDKYKEESLMSYTKSTYLENTFLQ